MGGGWTLSGGYLLNKFCTDLSTQSSWHRKVAVKGRTPPPHMGTMLQDCHGNTWNLMKCSQSRLSDQISVCRLARLEFLRLSAVRSWSIDFLPHSGVPRWTVHSRLGSDEDFSGMPLTLCCCAAVRGWPSSLAFVPSLLVYAEIPSISSDHGVWGAGAGAEASADVRPERHNQWRPDKRHFNLTWQKIAILGETTVWFQSSSSTPL